MRGLDQIRRCLNRRERLNEINPMIIGSKFYLFPPTVPHSWRWIPSFSPRLLYSPPLCLSLLCWHHVPIHSKPSYIWSFVFPIKEEIYSVHSYFLYFKPAFGGLQMNEGVEVVSARLSWDHLAHLIKHRSFNLVFSFRRSPKTTSTSSSTTEYSRQQQHSHSQKHRQTQRHLHNIGQECTSVILRYSSGVNFCYSQSFGLSTRFSHFLV